MDFAVDPYRGDLIDVAAFRKRYGRRTTGFRRPPDATCPQCVQPVFPRGDDTPATVGHFAHYARSGPCLFKVLGAESYLDLQPVDPDPERSHWLRAQVLERWEMIIGFLQYCVPYLSPRELEMCLLVAARRRLWDRRHIEPWHVGPCLLVSNEFMPASGLLIRPGTPGRRLWFRFWFDQPMRLVEDLWIKRSGHATLYRGSFRVPAVLERLPGLAEALVVKGELVEPSLALGIAPSGPMAVVEQMRLVLARHLE